MAELSTSPAEPTENTERKSTLEPQRNWGALRDIPFRLTVEIGRNRMQIRDILSIEAGTLIVTTKLSGEPMDLSLNGDIFANSEIIIIKDKLWARLTKIVGSAG